MGRNEGDIVGKGIWEGGCGRWGREGRERKQLRYVIAACEKKAQLRDEGSCNADRDMYNKRVAQKRDFENIPHSLLPPSSLSSSSSFTLSFLALPLVIALQDITKCVATQYKKTCKLSG